MFYVAQLHEINIKLCNNHEMCKRISVGLFKTKKKRMFRDKKFSVWNDTLCISTKHYETVRGEPLMKTWKPDCSRLT